MTKIAEKIKERLAEKATTDRFERSFYTRDLAPVPDIISTTVFNNLPDVVVRPTSIDEIVELMKLAEQEKVPVTPRAGATTAYLNAVPVKKGIVLDLTGFKGIVAVDEKNLTVTALAGTSWKELNAELEQYELTACSLPSSGESATIGGWFNMEGYGLGSYQYGCFHDQVTAAEIVLPKGEVIAAAADSRYPLEWFAGSEGTLGIVGALTFKVRNIPEAEEHFAVEYAGVEQVQSALEFLSKLDTEELPYNVHWSNPIFYRFLRELGYEVFTESNILLLTYQGKEPEVSRGRQIIHNMVEKTGGELKEAAEAAQEWEERFRSLRIKRGGPTLLAAEVIIPVKNLQLFCRQLQKIGQRAAVYGHMLDKERITTLVMYHADETQKIEYLFLMAKTKLIYDAAIKLGGRPYGIGLWNSVYLQKAYSQEQIRELQKIKKLLDPQKIINPGKILNPPLLVNPKLFALGAASANMISRMGRIGRGR